MTTTSYTSKDSQTRPQSSQPPVYVQGHSESVVRAHAARTAYNSAPHLIPHLKNGMKVLDCGCGPGSISISLAQLVGPSGSVIGIEPAFAASVLDTARELAEQQGTSNVSFETGDIHTLEQFEDASFDVVHAHQVLQHIADPISALRALHRVLKPGGILSLREGNVEDASIYPFSPLLEKWKVLHCKVARGSGGEPAAGKQLHAWARKAGFDPAKMEKGVRATSYLTPEETRSFAQSWNERLKDSEFRSRAVQSGAANEEEVDAIAQGWLDWAADEDAWFALMQGEIIARV